MDCTSFQPELTLPRGRTALQPAILVSCNRLSKLMSGVSSVAAEALRPQVSSADQLLSE